ncbi:MAG: O-antigen ligase family protein [Isosphaeraceae bacterium]
MGFWLFVLVNGTLLVRPADLIPGLNNLPIYNVLIVSCLAATYSQIIKELEKRSLAETPISACVLGLFGMLLLSNLARFDLALMKETGVEFAKVVLYYLMLLSVIDSAARLERFLEALTVFALIVAGLALCQYHGYVDLPALQVLERVDYDDDGGASHSTQLRSVGIYNDPNDLCLLLGMGVVIALYAIIERKGFLRFLWAGPLGVLLYALILTRSRGGFLALLVSLFCLFVSRFGLKKAVPLAALALPGLMLMSGGRQTEISVGQGTAQERMEKWKQGLILFTHRPITGIGVNRYADEVGLVAHNSYVHAYVEMGFPGGTLFVGLFYFAFEGLRARYYEGLEEYDESLFRLRPYLIAMIASYATGIFSLSRNYIVPTYIIFGVAAVFHRMAAEPEASKGYQVNQAQFGRLLIVSVGTLAAIKLFLAVASH